MRMLESNSRPSPASQMQASNVWQSHIDGRISDWATEAHLFGSRDCGLLTGCHSSWIIDVNFTVPDRGAYRVNAYVVGTGNDLVPALPLVGGARDASAITTEQSPSV